jgi:hypothetical protein
MEYTNLHSFVSIDNDFKRKVAMIEVKNKFNLAFIFSILKKRTFYMKAYGHYNSE